MKEERKSTIYSPINQETHMKKILMMLALIAGTVAVDLSPMYLHTRSRAAGIIMKD